MCGLAFALAELFAQGQLLYPYVPCVCTTSSGTLTSFSINKWVIVSEGAGGWWKVGGRDSREHRAAEDRLLKVPRYIPSVHATRFKVNALFINPFLW